MKITVSQRSTTILCEATGIEDDPKFPRNKRKLMVAKKKEEKRISEAMKSSGKNVCKQSLPLPTLKLEKGNHKSASDRRKRLKRREVEWEKEDETGITATTSRLTHT